MPSASVTPALEARHLRKTYGSVVGLEDANMTVRAGEIVALVGDNGAGKSTMIKLLAGAMSPSGGEILIDGQPVLFKNPADARRMGIETIYQDLALAPNMSVTENIFLGREVSRYRPLRWLGWVDRAKMNRDARRVLERLGITIPSLASRCGDLSGGQRQAVAIARSVAFGTRVVLMDEPTAALGVQQQQQVSELTRQIRDHGAAVIIVSHNLPQVQELCDRIVVLLHGRTVVELDPKHDSLEEVIAWITGSALVRTRRDGPGPNQGASTGPEEG